MSDGPIDILLVDDEPRNLDALEAILAGGEYRLLRAGEADRALHLLLENDVAVIVLDIKMPLVNGIELAQIIKGTRRFREIPIVFLTAHMVEDRDMMAGYGVGAVDYLTKPVNPVILRHKIAAFADLFRKTRALAELNSQLEARVKERTAELERSEQALRLASKQKDEFLATLAHELRNPLAPLRTGLDLILQLQSPGPPALARTLAAMNRQLDHLVRLIDDLLDVSRISRGVLELKRERADLTALAHGSAENFRSLLEQRGLRLVVDAAPGVRVTVDPTRVAQIVGNLLHNAMKFTPAGGEVRVELRLHGDVATLRVRDTGVGIPPDQFERIFDMFVKVEHAASRSAQGTGIGLALARRLALMHGGDLAVTSEGEGRGATFTLTLPGADLAERPSVTPSAPPLRRRDDVAAMDILVIEDNVDVGDTLAAWLTELGHRVTIARTGAEGVALAQRLCPRVVLCDIGLPEMDGTEVCAQVLAATNGRRPLMVALTGWGNAEDHRRTRAAGFDHHLVKPVALDTLNDVLRGAAV